MGDSSRMHRHLVEEDLISKEMLNGMDQSYQRGRSGRGAERLITTK